MQQVGPGPGLWWRADRPPAPSPVLRASAEGGLPRRPRRLPLLAIMLNVVGLTLLSDPERRMAALAGIEGAAEHAGLGLRQITVSGHRYTADSDIFAALELDGVRTLLSFDAAAARARIEALPWVERASVERSVPDGIDVRVSERVAFAVWKAGERSWLIDRGGRKLQVVSADAMPRLMRVAGEGADTEAAALAAALAAFPSIASRLDVAERVGARRWTLHLAGGVSAHLPADGEAEALARLVRLMAAGLEGAGQVDLRVSSRALLRERRSGAGVAAPTPGQRHSSSRKASEPSVQRGWRWELGKAQAAASPRPCGEGQGGGIAEHSAMGFREGEGSPRGVCGEGPDPRSTG